MNSLVRLNHGNMRPVAHDWQEMEMAVGLDAAIGTANRFRSFATCRAITLCAFLAFLVLLCGFRATPALAANPELQIVSAVPSADSHSPAATEEHGLSARAVEIARPFGFPITNSMIVSWIVALGLIVFAQLATRNMKQVPTGPQNVLEWLVEGLYKFMVGIIGPHLAQRTFWFFATIFIFILSANWLGLLPGVGSIGWGQRTAQGFRVSQPLLRGANADVNMTLAMALVFFAAWIVWSFREVGLRGFLKELFAPKGDTEGPLRLLMIVVFFAAGCLEVVSILFRPVSLSFRLYGNIFAGENLLESMSRLVPGFGWLVPIPFYFLELLMGLVQALVFMLLTAVFTMLMCQHESEGPAAVVHG
ncbi:MAG TPA: F0F1 ATP synthase subunit A [Terriglobales bacterium]|nr:F0F1 ATP synthase subunit A [Terriglobales bacterium]